jgi:hypothetical protein
MARRLGVVTRRPGRPKIVGRSGSTRDHRTAQARTGRKNNRRETRLRSSLVERRRDDRPCGRAAKRTAFRRTAAKRQLRPSFSDGVQSRAQAGGRNVNQTAFQPAFLAADLAPPFWPPSSRRPAAGLAPAGLVTAQAAIMKPAGGRLKITARGRHFFRPGPNFFSLRPTPSLKRRRPGLDGEASAAPPKRQLIA